MKKNTQKGFTLFIAVVVSGLMLIVVLSISNIALKETILSGAGRESELAFYAADSGVECTLFWDYRNPGHDHTAFFSPTQTIQCGSAAVQYLVPTTGVGIPPADFAPGGKYQNFDPGSPDAPGTIKPTQSLPVSNQFKITFANKTCAIVDVTMYYEGATIKKLIKSRGQTDCDNPSNPRRYERAIRVLDSR